MPPRARTDTSKDSDANKYWTALLSECNTIVSLSIKDACQTSTVNSHAHCPTDTRDEDESNTGDTSAALRGAGCNCTDFLRRVLE